MWPPSALRSSSRLRRCWPALRQARSLRSNSLAPRLASARCSLANQYRSIFLSGRCVRSKIGAPPSPRPSLLRIPAVFDCVRSRTRSRWARPRYPVRCSRLDTSRLLARADARRAGCARRRTVLALSFVWPCSRRLRTSRPRAVHEHVRLVAAGCRSEERARAVCAMCTCVGSTKRYETSGSRTRVYVRARK